MRTQEEQYPELDNKAGLMRAYKKTTLRDGDGDAWVERPEFPALLQNLVYFNVLARVFDAIDGDDDRRVDFSGRCAAEREREKGGGLLVGEGGGTT